MVFFMKLLMGIIYVIMWYYFIVDPMQVFAVRF